MRLSKTTEELQKKYTLLVVEFLKTHTLIPIASLEQTCSMPHSTIHQAINEVRQIPLNHLFNVLRELVKYGLKIDGFSCELDENGFIIMRKTVQELGVKDKDNEVFYKTLEIRSIATSLDDLD